MRKKKLVSILSALVLGCASLRGWAQFPQVPDPSSKLPQPPQQEQLQAQPTPVPPPVPEQLTPGQPTPVVPVPIDSPPPEPPSYNVFVQMGAADPCCPHGYWSAGGGGAYFVQPFFSSNPGFITSTTSGGRTFNTQQNIHNSLNGAPMGYLSYTFANGIGLRGRWFEFNGTGTAQGNGTTISPGSGFGNITGPASATAGSNLHLQAIDLEATYLLGDDAGHWSVLLFGGARYATITQSYALNVANAGTGNIDTFSASHSFHGFGPTVGFEGRYQLWNSCFALYGKARGSILFGTSGQNSSANAPDLGVNALGSNSQTMVLPVGELELGGEVFYVWGRLRMFAQLGVVGQAWWGAGNASDGLSLSNTVPSASAQSSTLGFIGGVARLGVSY